MASIIIIVLILCYSLYVIRKKIKDIKTGRCCSCSDHCGRCGKSQTGRSEDEE